MAKAKFEEYLKIEEEKYCIDVEKIIDDQVLVEFASQPKVRDQLT